ncbi:hypothetical protein UP09_22555 [Bradyrhizobium sp. LTSP885]|nr:hypothetical protein UP09_22555 [Bradyrhizobium sp. LTSP885]
MTPQEVAALTRDAPTVITRGAGLGVDAAEYETAASDPAGTARRIVKAARTRDAGGPTAPQMGDAAQAIIDAGKRRRAEGA